MRPAQVRAVEIVRASEEVQILGELDAETGVPGRIWKGAAVAEGDVGEIEDQAVAIRAADIAVVERADAGRDAKSVVAGSIEIAVP